MIRKTNLLAYLIAFIMVVPCYGASYTATIEIQVGNGNNPSPAKEPVATPKETNVKISMVGQMLVDINYSLVARSNVKLKVCNVNGQMVKELINSVQGAGLYSAAWDGSDTSGNKVPMGVYVMTLDIGQERITKMVTLIK